ncbi:MAG: hypothetical protein HYU56_03600 [Candidatus Aenigmarchaeota archaeon]|nr:hypothetical protein [Candidatus Aenigmarchaeota archaeon]
MKDGNCVLVYAADRAIGELAKAYLEETGLQSPIHICGQDNVRQVLDQQRVAFAFVRDMDLQSYWQMTGLERNCGIYTFTSKPMSQAKGVEFVPQHGKM